MDSIFMTDALSNGITANAIKLGTILTLGRFWVRPSGCHTVYRGQDGNIDHQAIQAVMDVGDDNVSIEAQFLPPNTSWHYVRRQVSGCGLESDDSPFCKVEIDENGDMIGMMPNVPLELIAQQLPGARIKLRWRYSQIGQEIEPTGFRIYIDDGSGFDFNNPDGSILYRFARPIAGEMSWESEQLVHGQVYRFVLRSYHDGEGETRNLGMVSAVADAIGPDAINGITASVEVI